MPDLFLVIARRWRLILFLTLAGTAAAYAASLLSPKLYAGVATALPANSVISDKARVFNQNIEALYSEIGTPDELDKIEGTAKLDTLFLAVAANQKLAAHYGLDTAANDALQQAAQLLKKASDIRRTGYGELKIQVWDKKGEMAATLANELLQTINNIYERLQTENNRIVLQKLKEEYYRKLKENADGEIQMIQPPDSIKPPAIYQRDLAITEESLSADLKQYANLINEYELAVKTTPKALLIVEQAHPSPWYDRPKTSRNVLLAFVVSLLFSFLLAVFLESRKART